MADEDNPLEAMSPQEFLKWLHRQPEWFRERLQELIWTQHPEMIFNAVKVLRGVAADPTALKKDRAEADRLLQKTGFDDASLERDDD